MFSICTVSDVPSGESILELFIFLWRAVCDLKGNCILLQTAYIEHLCLFEYYYCDLKELSSDICGIRGILMPCVCNELSPFIALVVFPCNCMVYALYCIYWYFMHWRYSSAIPVLYCDCKELYLLLMVFQWEYCIALYLRYSSESIVLYCTHMLMYDKGHIFWWFTCDIY